MGQKSVVIMISPNTFNFNYQGIQRVGRYILWFLLGIKNLNL